MAGGMWTIENKVLPGVYNNIIGEGPSPSVIGDRGIVALPVVLPWLAEHTVLTLYPANVAQFVTDFGQLAVPVREAMKNAMQVYLYRLNKGTKAEVTLGNLKCEAKHSGTFGDRLKVSVEASLSESGKFYVITWLDTSEVERQTVSDIGELLDNDWISFSAVADNKTLTANAGVSLAGGENGTVTNSDYAKALSELEPYSFDAIACISDETDVKNLFVAYVKRMVNDEGKYMQAVIPDVEADFEAVISVKDGVYLSGREHIPNTIACAYIAGATAAVPLSESLTNATYDGAVDVDFRYTQQEQIELAKTGQLVFIPSTTQSNRVVVQKDINTLTTFDEKHTYAMSKNKIMRIAYYLATNADMIARNFFIGKTPNDTTGRRQIQSRILTDLFRELEKQRVLRDVSPEDIVVSAGTNGDAVVIDYAAKVVDVVEIIYGTIRIQG